MVCFIKITSFNLYFDDLKECFVYSDFVIIELQRLLKQNVGLVLIAFLFLDQTSYVKENTVPAIKVTLESFDQLVTFRYHIQTQQVLYKKH